MTSTSNTSAPVQAWPGTARAVPLLVAGHGTRSAEGVEQFEAFVARLRSRLAADGVQVAGGFIELAPPPLTDAVSRLVDAGHRRLAVVPLVLVAAGHGKGDIPAAMAREVVRHPGLGYVYGRPLWPHPALLTGLEERIERQLSGWERADVTVVLVGRGSTDPDANAEVAKAARLLWEGRGFAGVETAFISLAEPSVPQALERARVLGARRIVVAPFFLFAGVLPDRIVEQSRAWAAAQVQAGQPEVEVRMSGLLGDAPSLVDVVLERYAEALAGDIRMNCDTCLYRVALPGVEHRVGAPQRPHDHPHDPTDPHAVQEHGHDHGG